MVRKNADKMGLKFDRQHMAELTSLERNNQTLFRHLGYNSDERSAHVLNVANTMNTTRIDERRMPSSKQGVRSNCRIDETGPHPSKLRQVAVSIVGATVGGKHDDQDNDGEIDLNAI